VFITKHFTECMEVQRLAVHDYPVEIE